MSTKLHDDVICGVINAAEELQLSKGTIEALQALRGSKSASAAGAKLGISDSAFTKRLFRIHGKITDGIRRLKEAQPAVENRKPINWNAFDTRSFGCLRSLTRRPEFFEDIIYLSYELPHVRGLAQGVYEDIAAVVNRETGKTMPSWGLVTRKL